MVYLRILPPRVLIRDKKFHKLRNFSKISGKEVIQHNRSSDYATRAKLTTLVFVTLNKL
jgi:hypothetical protein